MKTSVPMADVIPKISHNLQDIFMFLVDNWLLTLVDFDIHGFGWRSYGLVRHSLIYLAKNIVLLKKLCFIQKRCLTNFHTTHSVATQQKQKQKKFKHNTFMLQHYVATWVHNHLHCIFIAAIHLRLPADSDRVQWSIKSANTNNLLQATGTA